MFEQVQPSAAEKQALIEEINYWRTKRNALILAHNYQIPEIQDLADFVADSLALSQKAAQDSHELIVFCGVHFMAESAAIFNPEKTVLIPDPEAGCSLAASIDVETLRAWKARYPNAVVVSYVNTTAEVKAESDYCCTSSNAVRVVESIPADREILFLPDMFLGDFVARKTGRKIYIYNGECHVHAHGRAQDIQIQLQAHPGAEFLVHPECGCTSSVIHHVELGEIPEVSAQILSTNGMLDRARQSPAHEFVVATEIGILHRLGQQNPDKKFTPLREDMVCQYMKMITLDKLLNSLKSLTYAVRVPPDIAARARIPIERMLAIG
ncbi:MAG TPA: quinolinate synthase NadA [Aggregatilineales bacterium]|nr:quinolinate synthase NadA [Aggregatilineales bacterium]